MILGFPPGTSPATSGGFGYGGRAFTPIPQNPASQGSQWFYRSPGIMTQNPPGTGRTVNRAPGAAVPDMQPGADPFMNRGKAFDARGKLVPYNYYPPGTFAGAMLGGGAPDSVRSSMAGLLMWGFIGGALVGLLVGAVASTKPGAGRAVASAVGGGVGAVAGMAGAVLVGRGATLAAKLVAQGGG